MYVIQIVENVECCRYSGMNRLTKDIWIGQRQTSQASDNYNSPGNEGFVSEEIRDKLIFCQLLGPN